MERLPRLTGHCLAPDGLNSRAPTLACPPHQGETSATIWSVGSRHVNPPHPRTSSDGPHMAVSSAPYDHETEDTRGGRHSSHAPIQAERSTSGSHTLPPVPQRTTNHPEQPIERGKHDSQTRPEDGDARVDDEPLHREADRARASVTTTRKPAPGTHATRVVERARERDAIAESHFQSNLSH